MLCLQWNSSHFQNCENYKDVQMLCVCLTIIFICLVKIFTWPEVLSAVLVELLLL